MQVIHEWQVLGPVEPFALEDHWFVEARELGVDSMQSYVHWSEIEPQRGVFDFGNYDPLVNQLRKHGLKWIPFIVAGPYYSTPKWFRDSPESVYARCLEHDRETVIQSIWNPNLPRRVDRYLKMMAEHYRPMGVLGAIELGISGNWGESIYPVGGGFRWKDKFHCHGGMWCGDRYAISSFRIWLAKRHGEIAELNKSWSTEYKSFSDITPKLTSQGSGAARRDLMRWYMESMTRYAELWLGSTKQHFPNEKIYICTGGNGNPTYGADFAAQAKLCARYGAGIWVTNGGDTYSGSFPLARWLSTACRHYGVSLITEPALVSSPFGVPMRIFDAMSLGAEGMYFKALIVDTHNKSYIRTGLDEVFSKYRKLISKTNPQIEVATLYPQEHFMLYPDHVVPYQRFCMQVRDLVDIDMVDESLILDGALEHYKALIRPIPARFSPEVQKRIDEWQRQDSDRVIVGPNFNDPVKDITEALRGRVWGDWQVDGIFHSRTDAGILALNSHAKPVVDKTDGRDVEIGPYAMVVYPKP